MLIDIEEKKYKNYFYKDPHPYISQAFIETIEHKVDRVVRLVDSDKEISIGLVAGVKHNMLFSPFSAPFGGFHYKHEAIFYDRIYDFIEKLKHFIIDNQYKGVTISLPPNIYSQAMNAKFTNAFIRLDFEMQTPDINNSIDLRTYDGVWTKSEVKQNCNRARRSGLSFEKVIDEESIQKVFEIISLNRKLQERKIHMSLEELQHVNKAIPIDFFLIKNFNGEGIGGGVFYRGHQKIVQGIFVGDLLSSRKLGTIDFLFLNVYNYYKELGFDFIDLGKSSINGEPNIGLVRFKEIHNCCSSLGFTFTMKNNSLSLN